MFGVNKKREEKERELEQALSSKQEEADQYAQKLTEAKGSMQAAWQEAESGFAAMEEGQKELEEELRGFAVPPFYLRNHRADYWHHAADYRILQKYHSGWH